MQHLRNNPNVTLYYSKHAQATGYVAITGHAELIDDRAEMIKRKRAYWAQKASRQHNPGTNPR